VSATAIVLILIAAVAHATWNLLGKQASAAGAVSFVWLTATAGTLLYTPVLAIAGAAGWLNLHPEGWLFLAGTGVLQTGYFLFLQGGYRLGDLSLVYPVGRGTGALLAAVAGIALLGERPGPVAIAGILAVVAGIAVIGAPSRPGHRPAGPVTPERARPAAAAAVGFAVATGVFIAGYTLWDKYAVSALGTSPLLQGFAAFPFMAAVLAPQARRSATRTAAVWRQYRAQVVGAAALMPLAYILVLAALSFTAVSVVAPAREVSVLFGVLFGRQLLGEGSMARRLAAAAAIVAGIIAIAIG
jgi:drug/metabolite transporter (DMT)-like permease